MRILQVLEEYPKTFQHYLAKMLSLLVEDINCEIFTLKGSSRASIYTGLIHLRSKIQRVMFKLRISEFDNLRTKTMAQFDLVHFQASFLFPYAILLLKLRRKPKIVITLRGADTYIKPWIDIRWKSFYRDYGNLIDAFVVVSEDQKRYLHEKWGINNSRIHVIYVSMALDFSITKKEMKSDSELRIVSSFRFTWEKNIQGNLLVIRNLKQNGYNVRYTICGEGNDLGMIYYFIDKYDLSQNVYVLGKVDSNDYVKILSRQDYYLQLSHSEALSASVIEAQGMGLPAIVSDADGIPEAIINGETGYSISSYNYEQAASKILWLHENPTIYNSFSERAIHNVAKKFSLNYEIEKIKNLYASL